MRPGGSLRDHTVAFARALTHRSDPFGGLVRALQSSSGGGRRVDYQRDIRPWLGGRIALFYTSVATPTVRAPTGFSSTGAQGAVIAATTDAAQARSFLDREARAMNARAAAYRGVSYEVASDGTAEGVVGSFAVLGSESALHAVVDTEQGGPALTRAAAYQATRAPASNRLAEGYVDIHRLLAEIRVPRQSRGLLVVRQLLDALHLGTAGLALTVPSAREVAIDVRRPLAASSATPASSSGAGVLAGLPGDSWLAVGVGDLGRALSGIVKGLSHLGSLGGLNFGALARQLRSRAGFDVQRDLLSWMGGAGLFVRGGSLLDLGAALVVDSRNPARSRAAVGKLGTLLRRSGDTVRPLALDGADAAIAVQGRKSPLTIDIVDGQGKFVVGLGDAAVTAALHPATTLASAPIYARAEKALGGGIRPSALVDVPSLLSLVEALGVGSSSSFQSAKPSLEALSLLAAGGQATGSIQRDRLVLTLR